MNNFENICRGSMSRQNDISITRPEAAPNRFFTLDNCSYGSERWLIHTLLENRRPYQIGVHGNGITMKKRTTYSYQSVHWKD